MKKKTIRGSRNFGRMPIQSSHACRPWLPHLKRNGHACIGVCMVRVKGPFYSLQVIWSGLENENFALLLVLHIRKIMTMLISLAIFFTMAKVYFTPSKLYGPFISSTRMRLIGYSQLIFSLCMQIGIKISLEV